MPAYSPERMSERELRDIVAYIRWLNERDPD
jgi:cytochrome c1